MDAMESRVRFGSRHHRAFWGATSPPTCSIVSNYLEEIRLGLGVDVSTTTEDVGEEDNGLGGNPSHPVSLL
jgi:hypothetical protein